MGLLTVVGLSAKNAILIIEFAKERQDLGYSLYDSVTVAARQRLRPIIMTSLAFGIGVVPLFLATGAGSGSQNAIGTKCVRRRGQCNYPRVFFIPMFYVWIRSLIKGKNRTTLMMAMTAMMVTYNPYHPTRLILLNLSLSLSQHR